MDDRQKPRIDDRSLVVADAEADEAAQNYVAQEVPVVLFQHLQEIVVQVAPQVSAQRESGDQDRVEEAFLGWGISK